MHLDVAIVTDSFSIVPLYHPTKIPHSVFLNKNPPHTPLLLPPTHHAAPTPTLPTTNAHPAQTCAAPNRPPSRPTNAPPTTGPVKHAPATPEKHMPVHVPTRPAPGARLALAAGKRLCTAPPKTPYRAVQAYRVGSEATAVQAKHRAAQARVQGARVRRGPAESAMALAARRAGRPRALRVRRRVREVVGEGGGERAERAKVGSYFFA